MTRAQSEVLELDARQFGREVAQAWDCNETGVTAAQIAADAAAHARTAGMSAAYAQAAREAALATAHDLGFD